MKLHEHQNLLTGKQYERKTILITIILSNTLKVLNNNVITINTDRDGKTWTRTTLNTDSTNCN